MKIIAISLTTVIVLGLIASGIGSLMGFSLFAGLSFTTGLGTANEQLPFHYRRTI